MGREYTPEVRGQVEAVSAKFADPVRAFELLQCYVREDGHFYSVNGMQRDSVGEIGKRLEAAVPNGRRLPVAALDRMLRDYGVQSENFAERRKAPSLDDYDRGGQDES